MACGNINGLAILKNVDMGCTDGTDICIEIDMHNGWGFTDCRAIDRIGANHKGMR